MKKALCILLALSLCTALLAGCSGGETSDTNEPVKTSDTVSEEIVNSPTIEAKAPDENTPGQPSEEPPDDEPSYTLPISDDALTYSLWMTYAPFAGMLVDTTNLQEMSVFAEITKTTNIHFDITAANGGAETENFNLMIAAGDYCDVITNMNNYVYGKEGAVEEGIIQDLASALPEKCPIYWSYLSADTNTLMSAYTESGYMPSICILAPEVGQESQGLVIRQDWLDKFGMEVPTTLEELTAYLKTAYSTYGATYDITNTTGIIQELGAGLNIYLGGYSVENGTVSYGYAREEFKNYLKFINNLFDEGIISPDFFSQTTMDLSSEARKNFAVGKNSMVLTTATNTADIIEYANGAEVPMVVQPYVSADGTTEPHVLTSYVNNLIRHDDTWSFTTECENIDPLLQLVEFLYSEDGFLVANYGSENEAYTLDENGDPQWTDLVINNPDGLSFFFASYIYATNAATAFIPYLSDLSKTFYAFNDNQWQIFDDLKDLSDGEYNIPSFASMTADENTEYSSLYSDVNTFVQTAVLQFITGSLDIDEGFDGFVEGMNDLGLERMIEIEQAVYDRAAQRREEMEKSND